jgi:hypothetical protein
VTGDRDGSDWKPLVILKIETTIFCAFDGWIKLEADKAVES